MRDADPVDAAFAFAYNTLVSQKFFRWLALEGWALARIHGRELHGFVDAVGPF
jgi:hypothetical protein